MDLSFTKEQEAFRRDVAAFIEKELPPGITDEVEDEKTLEFSHRFAKKLAEKQWLCIGWPKEYGGGGYSLMEQAIFAYEVCYHRASFHTVLHAGINFVGPALLLFGSEEQKKKILIPIAKGDLRIGLGFSEPDAGSDLASLKTRAKLEGSHYVIDGQKIYQTYAHQNEMVVVAARTNPEVSKHKGISIMLCDLKSHGITMRPQHTIDGLCHQNEIFFDHVRVPKENLLGEENQGWSYMGAVLTFERGSAGLRMAGTLRRDFDDFVRFCREAKRAGRPLCEERFVQQRLVEIATELEALTLLAWRVVGLITKKQVPTVEASALNLSAKEWKRHFAEKAMEILGPFGQLEPGSKWAPMAGKIERIYMATFGLSAAATPEIMKNVMATRGLGLPK